MRASAFGLTFPEFAAVGREAFLQTRGDPKGSGVAAELYRALFKDGTSGPGTTGLTDGSFDIWTSAVSFGPDLEISGVLTDPPGDGPAAAKVVFAAADGSKVETVLVPMGSGDSGRGTLCVSSQAGCAMGCAFCETGRGGLVRNLTASEITAQVHIARFTLGWDFSSLVFMGMGEPLDNLSEVTQALRVLMDPRGFAFAQERITVCTVGLAEGITALGALGWKRLGLSLSLNSANQALRDRLMPAGRSNSLEVLHRVLAAYPQRKNFVLALNYCLLPGINDGPDAVREVGEFARGLGRVLVNLIPYNPGTAPLCRAPTPEETESFLGRLRSEGLDARIRGPKGRSIMAACGQLGAS